MPAQRRVLRDGIDDQRDTTENERRQRNATKLAGDEHKQRDGLCCDEEAHERHLLVLHRKAMLHAALARGERRQDQREHQYYCEQPANSRRQVVGGQQRVHIALPAGCHGNGGVVNDAPEEPLENQQSAECDNEGRHALAHDECAHRHPDQNTAEKSQPQRGRRRQVAMKHQHARNAAEQADAAACGQINMTWQQDEQHAHRQCGGDRQLGDEHRQIARAQKRRILDGKERADREQCDGDGQFSK